jgi:hypothetical protein
MDKLQELLAAGVDPTRGLQNLVLAHFHTISALRARLRRWEEIAAALDLPATRAKALRAAYARVGKKVRAGVLEPPVTAPTRQSPVTKSSATNVDPDSGFRKQVPRKSEETSEETEAKKWL